MRLRRCSILALLALVVLSCGEVPTPPAPGGNTTPVPPTVEPTAPQQDWPAEAQPLVQRALADLTARTKTATATVVSVEAAQWPDGCLGCAQEGELCAQVIVSGYRIVLQAEGRQYEYRTDAHSTVRLCPAEAAWSAEAQESVDKAIADLVSQTQGATVTVVSVAEVQWPDGCLGCRKEGEMCTEAVVPGYRIVLQQEGQQYEYRAGKNGTIRQCAAETDWGPAAQPLVDKALADLAGRLQIGRDEIKVVSVEQMMWRDSSIGCAKPGQSYLTVIVPGYKIVLEAKGTRYNYHAGEKGEVFWCEQPTQ